MDTKYLKE